MTNPNQILADLGWSAHFMMQLEIEELDTLTPVRVSEVMRDRVTALGVDGPVPLMLRATLPAGDIAVGDWLLADLGIGRAERLLDRRSLIARKAAGRDARRQLIAANVNTLFIVSSCNADFNIPRLERYVALALEAETDPVIVLTKADLCDDPDTYDDQARRVSDQAEVVVLDATDPAAVSRLSPWCGKGQTVALIGSSGVGKSTLVEGLTGEARATAGIRDDDAKGRHTTTARSLHRIEGGGWLVDTPGMRELALQDVSEGIDQVFSDVIELATQCRFRDCAHDSEPGCAIQAAIADGTLDAGRLDRWRSLKEEDARNTATIAQTRQRDRNLSKMYKSAQTQKKGRKGGG